MGVDSAFIPHGGFQIMQEVSGRDVEVGKITVKGISGT
jgi:hypothetical protein